MYMIPSAIALFKQSRRQFLATMGSALSFRSLKLFAEVEQPACAIESMLHSVVDAAGAFEESTVLKALKTEIPRVSQTMTTLERMDGREPPEYMVSSPPNCPRIG